MDSVGYFRARQEYWENLKPSSGRPFSSAMSMPDRWGVTKVGPLLRNILIIHLNLYSNLYKNGTV